MQAFNFQLLGQPKTKRVYRLGSEGQTCLVMNPPNLDTQVPPGMQGELWSDTRSYEWVKVTARVVRPIAIEGLLAQVEPGTICIGNQHCTPGCGTPYLR